MSEIEKTVDTQAKAFELRALTADDVFPMFQIISKIGVKDFKSCFSSPEVQKAITGMASGEGEQADLTSIGMSVAIDLAGLIISRLPDCKNDIYLLLSQLSGMSKDEIGALPMGTFVEMVIAVIQKDEFKDFFTAVSKLFK